MSRPYIWVPKIRFVDAKQRIVTPRARVQGMFGPLIFRKPDGRERVVMARPHQNLVLDSGLDRWGTGGAYSYCHVGSGNTAPSVGQTSLASWVATSDARGTDTVTGSGASPWWTERQIPYEFYPPVQNYNIAEIGCGWTDTQGQDLFCRSLIVDESDQPTTIAWQTNETLIATWTIRNYLPEGQATGTISLSVAGTTHDYTVQAADIDRTNRTQPPEHNDFFRPLLYSVTDVDLCTGPMGSITTIPSGSKQHFSASNNNPYTPGSYKQTGSVTWGGDLPTVVAKSIHYDGIHTPCQWQLEFDAGDEITKELNYALTLDLETMSWGRYTP